MEASLTPPDRDDRHVLAAAIVCRADVIVTYNLKHFPLAALAIQGIVAEHPDPFIRRILDGDTDTAIPAIRALRARLKTPPQSADEYLGTLLRHGLPETAAFLRPWAAMI